MRRFLLHHAHDARECGRRVRLVHRARQPVAPAGGRRDRAASADTRSGGSSAPRPRTRRCNSCHITSLGEPPPPPSPTWRSHDPCPKCPARADHLGDRRRPPPGSDAAGVLVAERRDRLCTRLGRDRRDLHRLRRGRRATEGHRSRERRRVRIRAHRRRRGDGNTLAARDRARRPRPQRPLAAPHPIRSTAPAGGRRSAWSSTSSSRGSSPSRSRWA